MLQKTPACCNKFCSQSKERKGEEFLVGFCLVFLVKAVIDEVLIPFSLLTGLNHGRTGKNRATFLPTSFYSICSIGSWGQLDSNAFIFCLLPFCTEQNRENITKICDFQSLKNRTRGFKIMPETTSDNIFLQHIKMQVGTLSLPPLW